MDRVISLLAALVGLIALGGAVLVHVNSDAQRSELATQIAQLRAAVGPPSVAPASEAPMPIAPMASGAPSVPAAQMSSSEAASAQVPEASAAPNPQAEAMTALQDRVAELEAENRTQASLLAAANARLDAVSADAAPAPLAAADSASSSSSASAVPAAIVADGPTTNCIPLGTRFMGSSGDSFAICKTRMVVKVAAVNDGLATIGGAGEVAEGGVGALDKGCNVSVFSADLSSGYAEMRVTCP